MNQRILESQEFLSKAEFNENFASIFEFSVYLLKA